MAKPIILLVEDDLALLNGMCDTLDMVGYQTVSATNVATYGSILMK